MCAAASLPKWVLYMGCCTEKKATEPPDSWHNQIQQGVAVLGLFHQQR